MEQLQLPFGKEYEFALDLAGMSITVYHAVIHENNSEI